MIIQVRDIIEHLAEHNQWHGHHIGGHYLDTCLIPVAGMAIEWIEQCSEYM